MKIKIYNLWKETFKADFIIEFFTIQYRKTCSYKMISINILNFKIVFYPKYFKESK